MPGDPQVVAPNGPTLDPAAARDRALGCLLGLAVGDAVGTTLEFSTRDSLPPLTDMIGGGPFHLRPGEWTDDTTMALCLADSLLVVGDFEPCDFMKRLRAWVEHGENTVPGRCFDIGATTAAAIRSFAADGDPYAGSVDAYAAGNGSLVRLAPVAIAFANDPEGADVVAAQQSRTTHGALECVGACRLFVAQLADALNGADRAAATRPRGMSLAPSLRRLDEGAWRDGPRERIRSSGYVVHTLEAALWAVGRTDTFRDAVLTAANLADDADSVAAVAGQLAGALYGASGIPPEWLERLAWREVLEDRATRLHALRPPRSP
jgi:ADP-ribosyl-[dinitrogen reductase] hydrolase